MEQPGDAVEDLDHRAARIMVIMRRLEEAIDGLIALVWERDYERSDLLEEVQNLQRILRDNTILGVLDDPPPRPRTETEVELEREIHDLERELRKQMSQNWEWREKIKDMDEELWNLEKQLRNSVPVGDMAPPAANWRRGTALEKALKTRVMELEAKIKNPKGRGRSRSI